MVPYPLVIATTAFGVFTALLWLGYIGEVSYCFLAVVSVLLGLVLHGFSRLQELDLKNLRLVLREIEQTKQELFVREEKLKSIVAPLAQVIALTGASEGRLASREFWVVKRKWYVQKLQSLIELLGLSTAESLETLKYTQKYAEIDSVFGARDGLMTSDPDYEATKAKLDTLGSELVDMMKEDISK